VSERAPTPEALARRAVAGDRSAVESLRRDLEDPVHALAIRMLWQRRVVAAFGHAPESGPARRDRRAQP
jgi:hypothetical protein